MRLTHLALPSFVSLLACGAEPPLEEQEADLLEPAEWSEYGDGKADGLRSPPRPATLALSTACSDLASLAQIDCTITPWPGGVIPYRIDSSFSAADVANVEGAMNDWSVATGGRIRFVPVGELSDNYAYMTGSGGCFSPFGYSPGRVQVSLRGCGRPTMRHELGHLIGLQHHHKRADRDRYVNVADQAICQVGNPPLENCFAAGSRPGADGFCGYGNYSAYRTQLFSDNVQQCNVGTGPDIGPYDYDSIMQYASTAPTRCGQPGMPACYTTRRDGTLITSPPGGRDISPGDGAAVRELYAQEWGWSRSFQEWTRDPGATTPLDGRPRVRVEFVGSPAIASDGALVRIVARGSDGHYYVRPMNLTGTTWLDLGGDFVSDPALTSRGLGRFDLVGIDTAGRLRQKSFTGNRWGGSYSIVDSGPAGSGATSSPTIASWGADRLDVFVQKGGRLHQKTFDKRWLTGWQDRGCCIEGKPAAVSWGTGRIDVAARGADGRMWHIAFDGGAWAQFRQVGGSPMRNKDDGPAIATTGANKLEIFVTGTDTGLWEATWDGTQFTPFVAIGSQIEGSPSAIANAQGGAQVAFRRAGSLWTRQRTWR